MGPREFHEELPSTQDRALALARAGADEGTVVVARRQSLGRGRGGRSWASPEGGLYASVVLRIPPEPATMLSLGVGTFLARALRARYAAPVRVKWPNDIVAVTPDRPPRKLAGILVDSVPSSSLGRVAVVGIGVNVRTPARAWPGEVAGIAASLEEFRTPAPPVAEVERVAVEAALAARKELVGPGGAERVRSACEELLYGIGRPVTVDGVPFGRVAAVGPDGELLVDADGRRRAVRVGEVRVEEGT